MDKAATSRSANDTGICHEARTSSSGISVITAGRQVCGWPSQRLLAFFLRQHRIFLFNNCTGLGVRAERSKASKRRLAKSPVRHCANSGSLLLLQQGAMSARSLHISPMKRESRNRGLQLLRYCAFAVAPLPFSVLCPVRTPPCPRSFCFSLTSTCVYHLYSRVNLYKNSVSSSSRVFCLSVALPCCSEVPLPCSLAAEGWVGWSRLCLW